MKLIFTGRVQNAAVVAVVSFGILAVVNVMRGMLDLFLMSVPLGLMMLLPMACAAFLFAWAARCQDLVVERAAEPAVV